MKVGIMQLNVLIGLSVLASVPAFAQDQTQCKAYFQVVRAREGSPGLSTSAASTPE